MALSELGAFLRRHREERELSLEDLEEVTRIRRAHLEAIERGDWEKLPPGVYVRGLLKSYARAVGVSQASVMRMYVKERPSEARLPEPQLISQPLLNEPRFSIELVLAVVIMGVALVLMGWMVNTYVMPAIREAGGGEAELVAEDPTGEPAEPGNEVAAAASDTPSGPTATRRPTLPALASSTPAATATPEPAEGLQLRVEAEGNVWLRIAADDEVVFEGFLRQGENDSWEGEADGLIRLRTGNAAGTSVTLNGQQLEALGGPGEVREYEWRLLPNGDIEQSG